MGGIFPFSNMFHFTDSEAKLLIKSLVYLYDSREQANSHWLDYFAKKGLKTREKKLESGDYSVMAPGGIIKGIERDIYFSDNIVIERKNSLEELSGNLTVGRDRFNSELKRTNATVYLIIEDGEGWERIMDGRYETNFQPLSFYHSLNSMIAKYGMQVHFMPRKLAPLHAHHLLEMYVRKYFGI